MVKKKKRYLGSFSNEEEAARAYDNVALQHHGMKAKTNYDYTKEEVAEIMAAKSSLFTLHSSLRNGGSKFFTLHFSVTLSPFNQNL